MSQRNFLNYRNNLIGQDDHTTSKLEDVSKEQEEDKQDCKELLEVSHLDCLSSSNFPDDERHHDHHPHQQLARVRDHKVWNLLHTRHHGASWTLSQKAKERLRNIFGRHQASHCIHYLVDGALALSSILHPIPNSRHNLCVRPGGAKSFHLNT